MQSTRSQACALCLPLCPTQGWGHAKRSGAAAETQKSSFDLPGFSWAVNHSTGFNQQREQLAGIHQWLSTESYHLLEGGTQHCWTL